MMRKLLMIMAMVAVIAMVGTASAVPISITTKDGGVNADATADEYGGTAAVPADGGDGVGDRVVPSWQSGAGNYSGSGILRFDLAPIAGGTVTSAQLDLRDTGQRAACTLNFRGLNDGEPGQNWDEATTTGSTAPGVIWDGLHTTTMEDTGSTMTTLLGTMVLPVVGENALVTFSSAGTELVDFLNADTDGMVNIVINYTSGNPGQKRQFASNNHASYAAPTLVLEFDPAPAIPEPAGLGLLGVALLAMRRKRRAQ